MYGGGVEAWGAGYSGLVKGLEYGMRDMECMSITKSAKRLFISEISNKISLTKFKYFNKKYSRISLIVKNNQ